MSYYVDEGVAYRRIYRYCTASPYIILKKRLKTNYLSCSFIFYKY